MNSSTWDFWGNKLSSFDIEFLYDNNEAINFMACFFSCKKKWKEKKKEKKLQIVLF